MEKKLTGLARLEKWLSDKELKWSWLARNLGISRSAISQWQEIPPGRYFQIHDLTGIPMKYLRPAAN